MNTLHSDGPWASQFLKLPYSNMPEGHWKIYQDDEILTPIAILAEPIGGKKGDDGLSPTVKANVMLITQAPEMYQFIKETHSALTDKMRGTVDGLSVIEHGQYTICSQIIEAVEGGES